MTTIRVNTTTLKKMAKTIDAAGHDLYKVKSSLTIKGASARTYDQNSFGPRVRAICRQAARHADDRADVLDTLSSRLSLHAKDYETADNTFLKGLLSKLISFFTNKTDRELEDVSSLSNLASERNEVENGEILEEGIEHHLETFTDFIEYDANATSTNCYNFVMENRENIGKAVINGGLFCDQSDFYSGNYRGKSGTLDGYEYGQTPQLGAVMVESHQGSDQFLNGSIGHVSFVYEITYENGNPISFKIAEGNIDYDLDKTTPPIVRGGQTFTYDENKKDWYSNNGTRSPDCFVY